MSVSVRGILFPLSYHDRSDCSIPVFKTKKVYTLSIDPFINICVYSDIVGIVTEVDPTLSILISAPLKL